MSKELLCDYKDRLIKKHGYPEDFAQDLAIMTESLAEYYGPAYESTVFDAVMASKYVVAGLKKSSKIYELPYDVLEREGFLDVKGKDDFEVDRLKRSSSLCASKLSIIYDGSDFRVSDVERVVALPHYFDANNPDSMANISRETMRIINGYLRGYEIDGHTLTVHDGLSTEIKRLSLSEDGKVEQTFVSQTGIGLEEGLIKYDERKFVREYYDAGYDSPKEPSSCLVAGFLADNLGLGDMLREAQITKDQDALRSTLTGYDGLLRNLDELNDLEKAKLKNIDDKDIINELNKTIEEHFARDIAPLVQEMQASLGKDELLDGSYHASM